MQNKLTSQKSARGKKKKTCRKYNHRNLFSKGLNRLSVNNVITFLAKEWRLAKCNAKCRMQKKPRTELFLRICKCFLCARFQNTPEVATFHFRKGKGEKHRCDTVACNFKPSKQAGARNSSLTLTPLNPKCKGKISSHFLNYGLDSGKAPYKALMAWHTGLIPHSLQHCLLDTQAFELTTSWQDRRTKQSDENLFNTFILLESH